ncbi:Versatile peroxidase VPL1 like protein [Verticillium longisporum]|uniref:Peroxidase n=1 Tax=Verticillium longisporum TaxID=100787 RepID=A0A8I2ZDM4_VERLO|nr:Versatile peroxidase VPL1 like protein [Verticillium longisporum]
MRVAFVLAAFAVPIYAHPSMSNLLNELMARDVDDSPIVNDELLSSINGVSDSSLTDVGRDLKKILVGKGIAQDSHSSGLTTAKYDSVPKLGSDKCNKDTCCVWSYIGQDLKDLFTNPDNSCNRFARQIIRLAFHDCIPHAGRNEGGCDASIVNSKEENGRRENQGMQEITSKLKELYGKYDDKGISMADLIQFGASVAVHTCPGGPRYRVFMGRKDTNDANPSGLVPTPFDTADDILKKFREKSFLPRSVIALLGAHTVSQQFVVNTTLAGEGQDTTPNKWDQNYFAQTLDPSKAKSPIFTFQSDTNLAKDSDSKSWFELFLKDKARWDNEYAYAVIRLSLLNIYNLNDLKECSKALP